MDLLSVFSRAAADHERGATEIERDLVQNLLASRDQWTAPELANGARHLLESQPAMANLRRIAAVIRGAGDLDSFERILQVRRVDLLNLGRRLAVAGAEVVLGYDRVISISRSSAVLAVLVGAVECGWRGRVAILDGTSAGRGREQAVRLETLGLEVQSLPDGAVFEAFDESAQGSVVLVGADAVGPRRVVNAQGSHLLLELAAGLGIHRVVVADSGKDLEEDEVESVLEATRLHEEDGPGRKWPVFEALPRELLKERISEHGRMLW